MSVHPERELLPRRASFAPHQPIAIEARGLSAPGTVTVRRLGDIIAEVPYDGGGNIALPPLPAGGYGVALESDGETFRTAVEVAADPRSRLRYGFVASFAPGGDVAGVADTVRRLHLTAIQFYDWAYRHADLMGGGESYCDALGQPIALSAVRDLIRAVQASGASALGYAAVYAAGPGEWPAWQHRALLAADGAPYGLRDFLFLLDPAAPDWLAHFSASLCAATKTLGFDGFHLDQYGYPKRAVRADGAVIEVAQSIAALIAAVRSALPGAHLVFNNVNDFPTRRTAASPQDAVYIEPWAPQLTLQSLADTVTRARGFAGGKPVVLAAYQRVYASAGAAAADRATAFTMATLFSHGATQLLAGEGDRILVDPYYVRNHAIEASTAEMLKRWYDFLVAHDELLMPSALTEVTNAYAGDYNAELDVSFAAAPITEAATAGAVWRRIAEADGRLIVHLINLVGQPDTLWDAPRAPLGDPGPATLRFRHLLGHRPRVRAADPDGSGRLEDLPVRTDGLYSLADLLPVHAWQMIVIDLHA